jgi:hypothetical protein
MKSTITKLKHALYLGAIALGFFSINHAEAQVCGASTYACAGLYGYSGDIDAITIKDNSGTLCSFSGKKCSSSTSHLGVVNAGSPIDLTAGQTITVDITGTSWSGYTTSPGVWIDADRDNSFAASECIIDPALGNISGLQTYTNVKIPCFTKGGKSYIRVRGGMGNYVNLTKNNGCGQANTYGNSFDIEVN